MRRDQAGFTLMEIMIVVALIGTLAAIAIPSFTSSSRKSKGDTEVNEFFTELRLREEAYAAENSVYLSTSSGETSTFPATPTPAANSLGSLPDTWDTLRVHPPESTARCGYVVIAGVSGGTAGSIASTKFGYTPPAKNWFYLLAHCDLDGSSTKDSYYFASSDLPAIQQINPTY